MTSDPKTSRTVGHIREKAETVQQFVLHPEDNDLFVRTGRQIIQACQLNISVQVWMEECKSMFAHVVGWVSDRSESVASCYAVPRGAGITLFFVPQSDSFDFDLADELAQLGTKLTHSFNVGAVEILQIPREEVGRFVEHETSQQVYSHGIKSHQAVET